MKKLLFTTTILLLSISIQAQWNLESNGTDITTTDKVGIGITTPSANLHIDASQTIGIPANFNNGFIKLTSGEYSLAFDPNQIYASKELHIQTTGDNPLVFNTNDTERIRILGSGNVGIGTQSPIANLHVKSYDYQDFIVLDRTANPKMDNLIYLTPSWDNDQNDQLRMLIGNTLVASFEETGNVGIGTHNPSERLHVSDVSGEFTLGRPGNEMNNRFTIDANSGYENQIYFRSQSGRIFTGGKSLTLGISAAANNLVITNSGNIGIGTTTTGTHKLAVEGTIGAREIKVEATGWSDFVFSNDYNLPSLEEVEKFITQNNHLPEIPSEAEVLEEGINLGEMNAKLLQKIEELTLYLIEQNKRINTLEEKLANKD